MTLCAAWRSKRPARVRHARREVRACAHPHSLAPPAALLLRPRARAQSMQLDGSLTAHAWHPWRWINLPAGLRDGVHLATAAARVHVSVCVRACVCVARTACVRWCVGAWVRCVTWRRTHRKSSLA